VRTDLDSAAADTVESSLPFTAVMLFFASATFLELSTFPPDPQALAEYSVATNNPHSALSRIHLMVLVIPAPIPTHTRIRSC
jgi:hypothetical protein